MSLFSQAIISGLMSGALYTLLGVGLVLVYRTARVLNLAHGETFAITGTVAALLTSKGVPLFFSITIAVLTAVAFSTALHRFILRPRTDWPASTLILVTLGAAFVARGVMFLLVGSDPVSFPTAINAPPLRIAGGIIPVQGLVLIVLGFGVSIAVALFLTRTRLGKQMLATSENPFAAELLGVDIEKARLIAYAIGGLLGALVGVLLIPLIAVDFQSGLAMTMRGFIAAAIAGMSPVGVLASGLGLGIFESMIGAYFGALLQDPVIFGVLMAVALWQSRKIRFGGGKRA